MSTHPEMVGGPERDVSHFMREIPGLVAKDGAEGVFAAALPDGRAVAIKVSDGSYRARPPLMVAALRALGVDVSTVAPLVREVVTGHDHVVGEVTATFGFARPHRVAEIPFVAPLDDVRYGVAEQVSPLIRRVIANNPSKYSYRGTGTYIVGHGDVVVVDPGPALDEHRDALAAGLTGERVRAILVTHCHADHSPLAAWMRAETGAPTIAFGRHGAVEAEEDDDSDVKVKESIDLDFVPDIVAGDGDVVAEIGGAPMRAVHTPGHTSNHLYFSLESERALFTGDHVMGRSTTVISPPDGDMRAYMDSLGKVTGRHDEMLRPTHGNPITETQPFLVAYLAARVEREE
jgi:glyoxylase-like metal-dependent hydrolase (beta-lactamase superfamily II)